MQMVKWSRSEDLDQFKLFWVKKKKKSMTLLSLCNNASFVGNSGRFPRWHSWQAMKGDVCAHTHALGRITAALSRQPLRGLIYLSLHYITRSGFRDADVHTPTAALAHHNQVSSNSDNINAPQRLRGGQRALFLGGCSIVCFARQRVR